MVRQVLEHRARARRRHAKQGALPGGRGVGRAGVHAGTEELPYRVTNRFTFGTSGGWTDYDRAVGGVRRSAATAHAHTEPEGIHFVAERAALHHVGHEPRRSGVGSGRKSRFHGLRGGEPPLRRRHGRTRDDIIEPGGHSQCRDCARGPMTFLVGRHGSVDARALGQPSSQREMECQAERVEIGAAVAAPTREQFGSQVVESAYESTGAGDPGDPLELGGAKIGEPGPAIGVEQDVLRLHIAMNDSVPMCQRECLRHLSAEAYHFVGTHRPALSHSLGEIRPRHVLHDDEAPRAVVHEVMDLNDVGVGESAYGLHLAPHPLAGDRRCRRRGHQELDGDVGVERAVSCEIDDREAAAPEFPTDAIAAGEHHAFGEVGRAYSCPRPGGSHRELSFWSISRALVRQPSFS